MAVHWPTPSIVRFISDQSLDMNLKLPFLIKIGYYVAPSSSTASIFSNKLKSEFQMSLQVKVSQAFESNNLLCTKDIKSAITYSCK